MSDQRTLSIVVCSFNGAAKIRPCLEALTRQRLPVEILVIDDGSTDDTAAVARSYGVSVIRHEQNRGISVARNTGLRSATSTLVAYCDDDCSPPQDWTLQVMSAWNDLPDATVIGGYVDVDHPASFTQRYLEFRNPLQPAEIALARRPSVWYRFARQFRPPRLPTNASFPVYSVVGANMTVHRARVTEVGGFDESLAFGEGEELTLCASVRERFGEAAVVVDPRITLTHRFAASMDETWRRSFDYGRGAGERWHKSRGWPSLPVVGPTAVIAAVVIAPFSWLIGLLVGLAVLATPTAIWAVRSKHVHPSIVTYPFVALASDVVAIVGFLGAARGSTRQGHAGAGVERWPRSKDNWLVVKPTATWLAAALVLSVALALFHSPLAPLPGVISMLLIPGATVLSVLRTRPATTAGRVVLSVCLSMMAIMVVGGVASLIGPHLGVAHPLNVWPESVIWFVIALVVLALGAAKESDPIVWIFDDVHTPNVYGAVIGAVLVLLSILGVAQLNYSGDNFLSVFTICLDIFVLMTAVIRGWKRTSNLPLSALLYGVSLALLLSTSLRGGHLDGWDIQQEFGVALQTVRHGVWVAPANRDPYASMLSLTVLPAVLHSVVKLRLLAFFQLVVPAILAMLPVAVFTTIRRVPRWITYGRVAPRPGLAFGVTAGLIVSSVAFSSQLAGITRQAMALTMMTALVMVLFDRTMLIRPAQIVIGLLLVAIAFTHYTTSYLLSAILLCAWVASAMWSRGWIGIPRDKRTKHRKDVGSRRVINAVLVVVALGAAFGWNLGITRNSALTAPANAITTKGAGFATSSGTLFIPPRDMEQLLLQQIARGGPVDRSCASALRQS